MPTRLAAVLALIPALLATPKAAGTPLDQCSAAAFDTDPRLGPADLPTFGPVGFELVGYRRTGDETPQQFLAKYYNPTTNGWNSPPADGYVVAGGKPVEWTQNLEPGEDVDRFGSESGTSLAPQGLPYATRSIPPQSLDGHPASSCDYHDYRVIKAFSVHAGPVAPWFAQPGGGLQYRLDNSVKWLVNHRYLQRLI